MYETKDENKTNNAWINLKNEVVLDRTYLKSFPSNTNTNNQHIN